LSILFHLYFTQSRKKKIPNQYSLFKKSRKETAPTSAPFSSLRLCEKLQLPLREIYLTKIAPVNLPELSIM
jgi:hypothetical protein